MTAKPAPKPRTRSPEHAAATLCRELAALDEADAKAAEAAKDRKAKRDALLDGASPEVVKLAQLMRSATAVKS